MDRLIKPCSRRALLRAAALLPIGVTAQARSAKETPFVTDLDPIPNPMPDPMPDPMPNSIHRRILDDLVRWDAITDHRTGTQGDQRTAQWLSDELQGLGLAPVADSFTFQRRVLHDGYVAWREHRADGVPLFDGGVTGASGVQAPLSDIQADSGIGLVQFGPSPAHPQTQTLTRARQRGAHDAIVAVAAGDVIRPGLALLNADEYENPFGPPVLQVATQHWQWLTAARDAAEPVELVAHVTMERSQASNVQVEIPGTDPQLPPLVIMTPRSAWWTCTSERGGGISLWLECARHFAAHPPDRRVIFTANTGHELGHIGLERYLDSMPELANSAHAWVHLGANFAAQGSDLLFQASTQKLMDQALAGLAARGIEVANQTPPGTRPLGEARNIFDAGGDYVSLLGSNALFHHPDDRLPDAVDIQRTVLLSRAMLELVVSLARS